jgi:hypothetical protein
MYPVKWRMQYNTKLQCYVTNSPSEADLFVFVVNSRNEITKPNSGLWYITDYPNEANKFIFFCTYRNEANLIIYFVDSRSRAGWINKYKSQLLEYK